MCCKEPRPFNAGCAGGDARPRVRPEHRREIELRVGTDKKLCPTSWADTYCHLQHPLLYLSSRDGPQCQVRVIDDKVEVLQRHDDRSQGLFLVYSHVLPGMQAEAADRIGIALMASSKLSLGKPGDTRWLCGPV